MHVSLLPIKLLIIMKMFSLRMLNCMIRICMPDRDNRGPAQKEPLCDGSFLSSAFHLLQNFAVLVVTRM